MVWGVKECSLGKSKPSSSFLLLALSCAPESPHVLELRLQDSLFLSFGEFRAAGSIGCVCFLGALLPCAGLRGRTPRGLAEEEAVLPSKVPPWLCSLQLGSQALSSTALLSNRSQKKKKGQESQVKQFTNHWGRACDATSLGRVLMHSVKLEGPVRSLLAEYLCFFEMCCN